MNKTDEVFAAIVRERDHQRRTHGGALHSLPAWLLVIEGELEEAKRAWVKSERGDDEAALCEVLQVAACCVAALEQHGVRERIFNDNRGIR